MSSEAGGSTAANVMDAAGSPVIPGRECGSCTLCCKVYHVPEIDKVAGKWCTHCKPGKGCAIHDTLPRQCADFNCLWRTEETLTPAWKPERAKMVLSIFPQNGFIYVQVDPGAPSAWRKQPYYDQLRRWAEANLQRGRHVIVFVNGDATLIMPDQDVPLGPMKPTDGFSVRQTFGAGGMRYEVTRGGRQEGPLPGLPG
jgi:hypothetical protein